MQCVLWPRVCSCRPFGRRTPRFLQQISSCKRLLPLVVGRVEWLERNARSERCALGRLPEKADDALPRTLITQDFMQNRVPSPTEGLCENGFREVSLRELVCGATMPPLRKSNCLKEGSLSKRRLAAERAQCLRGSRHVLGVPVFVAANIPCGVSAGRA